jgi:hypothetical protein
MPREEKRCIEAHASRAQAMFAALSAGSVQVDSKATMNGGRGPNAVASAGTRPTAPPCGQMSIVVFREGRVAARPQSASSKSSVSTSTYVDFQYCSSPFGKKGSNAL